LDNEQFKRLLEEAERALMPFVTAVGAIVGNASPQRKYHLDLVENDEPGQRQ
jgi:hypothetical protein